jgi:hypothetical protein
MSETTSFLGGAALAGLAAVVLLRGGVNAGSPTLSPTQPLPPNYGYPTAPPGVPVGVAPTASPVPTIDSEKLRAETEQLKALLEQQRVQTEQLKTQLQSQQALIDTMNAQNKSSFNVQKPAAANSQIEDNPVFSNLLWMLGGVILAFGGGIALVGMFVLFAKQQRPSRTIEVVHDEYPGYLPSRRRSQPIPTRRTLKRVEAEEID